MNNKIKLNLCFFSSKAKDDVEKWSKKMNDDIKIKINTDSPGVLESHFSFDYLFLIKNAEYREFLICIIKDRLDNLKGKNISSLINNILESCNEFSRYYLLDFEPNYEFIKKLFFGDFDNEELNNCIEFSNILKERIDKEIIDEGSIE